MFCRTAKQLIDFSNSEEKTTPLHLAAYFGHRYERDFLNNFEIRIKLTQIQVVFNLIKVVKKQKIKK